MVRSKIKILSGEFHVMSNNMCCDFRISLAAMMDTHESDWNSFSYAKY